jgi:two-component sensor histidine kinase
MLKILRLFIVLSLCCVVAKGSFAERDLRYASEQPLANPVQNKLLQTVNKLNDSPMVATSNRDLQELIDQYRAKQKKQEYELLRKESILQKNRLQHTAWIKKVTVGGFIASLVIAGLFFYGYRNRQKINRLLASHQQEINLKNNSLQGLIDKQSRLLLEKEWLIKEIHHRIKNNLQIITSLLNAQSSYLQNDTALSAIRDSQNRIQSISLIHQKLFNSEDVALINIHSYVVELMKFLCDTFHVNQRIQFEFDIPEIDMVIAQAMPLGLIINEAITNIIKYAFPENKPGKVIISLNSCENGYYCFSIADNGVGFDQQPEESTASTLGMTLIRGLGDQLGATVKISSDKGVRISLKFPSSPTAEDYA